MFVSEREALEIALRAITYAPFEQDSLFEPWRAARLGTPVLVRDIGKRPSYWVVPVQIIGRAAGFVRVTGAGRVSAMGSFYQSPNEIDACPLVVTGIRAAEAASLAEEWIHPELGEVGSVPIYVHDGPPGREAWLIEVGSREGNPLRWIFVTPAFVYDRPAGVRLDETLE